MPTLNDIRSTFLDFFARNGHKVVESSPLVPRNDPTLMFTNTGEDLYESTRRAWQLRPDFFAYAELQGGTHDIVDEQPQAWVETIDRFLNASA